MNQLPSFSGVIQHKIGKEKPLKFWGGFSLPVRYL
jgi:hypothetical protein